MFYEEHVFLKISMNFQYKNSSLFFYRDQEKQLVIAKLVIFVGLIYEIAIFGFYKNPLTNKCYNNAPNLRYNSSYLT